MSTGSRHTWVVFGRVRIGTFVLASLLDFALAVVVLVALLSNFAAYESLQKALAFIVFFIQLFSTLCLCLLCFGRVRPLVDLGSVSTLLVFEIGSMVGYTLAMPLLPCSEDSKGILISCKFHHSFVLYGSSVSCVLLALFLLCLFPMLRVPLPKSASWGQPINSKSMEEFSDTASSLTYYSWDKSLEKKVSSDGTSSRTFHDWDRKPKQVAKPMSIVSQYSQASYSYALPGRGKGSLSANRPSASPKRPFRQASPTQRSPTTPETSVSYLRPFSPPPPPTEKRDSVGSAYAASWLMEPPRALLSSPKQSTKEAPQPTSRSNVSTTAAKWRAEVNVQRDAKVVGQRKHKPEMLSLDTSDSATWSDDVPRSPTPIDPHSPHSSFPPTPLSGALPKHPRLTMHMREMSLASSRNTSPSSSPRLL